MATINIAFGGQNIGVEIPDIALEATMQDVLTEARSQKQLLSSIAQKMGANTQVQERAQKEAANDIVQVIAEGNKDRRSILGGLAGNIRQSFGNMQKEFTGLKGDEKASDLISGFGGALGLGAIGAQVGTLFGIMEEFGHTMGNLRRVGSGYIENLKELRSATAEIGLGLEGFAAIVAENGVTVRSLGGNTTEGSDALIRMTKLFRENTKQLGYFGMSSQEMTRLLVDEAELRRRTLGTDMTNADVQDQMVNSVKEQLKLNEAMAKLTGQDIRDRIKAGQQFKSDAVNAAIMSTLTTEQQKKITTVVESLSALGPGVQGAIQSGITNLLSGGSAMMDEQFRSIATIAGGMGIDLNGMIEELVANGMNGASDIDLNTMTAEIANELTSLSDDQKSQLVRLAKLGNNEGAIMLLQTAVESATVETDGIADIASTIKQSMDELDTAIANGALELSGTTAKMEEAANQFRDTLMNSILNAFDAGDLETSTRDFNNFVDSLVNLPKNQNFKDFTNVIADTIIIASGAKGLVNIMRGLDNTVEEGAFLTAAGAAAAGLNQVADAARGLGNILLVPRVANDLAKAGGFESISDMFARAMNESGTALRVEIEGFMDWLRNGGSQPLPSNILPPNQSPEPIPDVPSNNTT